MQAKTVGHNPDKIRKYALMFVSSMHDTLAEVDATQVRHHLRLSDPVDGP